MLSIVQYPDLENLTKLELRLSVKYYSLRAITTSLYRTHFNEVWELMSGTTHTHIVNNKFKYLPSCELFGES